MNGEVRATSTTGGQKGRKEARYSLLPWKALRVVAELYGKGAEKYEEHNWRAGYPWSWSVDALVRHFEAFLEGEDLDAETGKPHLASIVFHALALITFMEEHPELDDRYQSKPELSDDEEADPFGDDLFG